MLSAKCTRSAERLRTRIVAALLLCFVVTTSHGQSDLERMRGEIARLRARLEQVRKQAQGAEQQLEGAELELGIRTRELQLAVTAERRVDAERHAIETQIAAIAPRIERQKQFLSRRLVALYRLGGLSYLRMFLSIDSRRDPIEAMSMLSFLVSRDARAVSRFQAARQQLSVRRVALADRQRQLTATRAVVEERRRALALATAEQQRILTQLRTEESGSARQLAELEEKAKRLERLVGVLSKQKGGLGAVVDVRTVQGALAWPVQGKVTERFGRQRNAKFATYTMNNGLKIAAAPGVPVRAVFQGTVLFSQWFKGYGNLIILDHGNRVFSLYGNIKAPSVKVGDRIANGQPIAGVGEGEEAKAGYLYFEIRNDNKPEDPQKWLR